MPKPKKISDKRLVVVNEDAMPISSSAPLQHVPASLQEVPPSPPPAEKPTVIVTPEVIIPAPSTQEAQQDDVDVFLEKSSEENVSPAKPATSEPIDEEIVVDKVPEENVQAEPSRSTQEEAGEQVIAPMEIDRPKETPADE